VCDASTLSTSINKWENFGNCYDGRQDIKDKLIGSTIHLYIQRALINERWDTTWFQEDKTQS
jgi:hypothetical protein